MEQLIYIITALSSIGLGVYIGDCIVGHIKFNRLRSALKQCHIAMEMCEGEHQGNLKLFNYEAVQGIWDHAKEAATEVLRER